jgi:serine/threonine protein kinase
MGHVFRAIDKTTRNPVAIKVLQRHEDSDVSRFLREARILSDLGQFSPISAGLLRQ